MEDNETCTIVVWLKYLSSCLPKITFIGSFNEMYNEIWHWRPNTFNSYYSSICPLFNLINFVMTFDRASPYTSSMSSYSWIIGWHMTCFLGQEKIITLSSINVPLYIPYIFFNGKQLFQPRYYRQVSHHLSRGTICVFITTISINFLIKPRLTTCWTRL